MSKLFNIFKNNSNKMASSSTPPARLNKQGRTRFAKETINKRIPQILKSNEKARNSIKNTELIYYSPSAVSPKVVSIPKDEPASSQAPKQEAVLDTNSGD